MFYKFKQQDIQINTLQITPEIIYEFSAQVSGDGPYLNKNSFTAENLINSSVNIFEYNVDRQSNQKIYPFVNRNNYNNLLNFSDSEYELAAVGDIITGSYDDEVGIEYLYFTYNDRYKYLSLRNKLISSNISSEIIDFKSGILSSIESSYFPALFIDRNIYGSKILEKSVSIKIQIDFVDTSGEIDLASGYYSVEACDYFGDGKLYTKTSDMYFGFPSNKEYVHVGYVFYSLGIIVFHNNTLKFGTNGTMKTENGTLDYTWKTFGLQLFQFDDEKRLIKFTIKCKGINNIPNINMFCKVERNHLNHSNNLTSIKPGSVLGLNSFSAFSFFENNLLEIENMVDDSLITRTHSVYLGDRDDLDDIVLEKFEKSTYISEIDIYDADYKRIAIAKLANPIKKREQDEFIFKLKVDI